MQHQPVMELLDAERLARQLRLLNDVQSQNMVGSWECLEDDDHYFWSDSMFNLHEIPVAPANLISFEEADRYIHAEDLPLLHQKREELRLTGYVEYYFRIITPAKNLKHIYARERRVTEQDTVIYRGNWNDRLREREFQQPMLDAYEELAIKLKVFERAEEVAQAGSWQINLETFETIYSDNIYRIYGLEPQSIAPHVDSFRKYIHPEDRTVVLRAWEKSYVETIPLHLEYRIIREDGDVRYIAQVSHLVRNSKGEYILSGNTRDVTEQKLLETQLSEANEILTLHNELFVQSEQISQLGTWQVNLNTRKTVYSSNLYRLYGIKPNSILPGLPNFIQFIHSDDRELVLSAYTKAFDEHIAPELEFRIIRADGKTRVLKQKSRYIKTDTDELLIGIVQDVTDQQQRDRLLKEANEKLQVQNESFRQAEKVAGIGIWTWNLDTNEIFYSDNIYNIYGLKPQSVPPGFESFGKYMHPEDRKWLKDIPEKIRTAREPISVDYRIIRADGELRYLRGKNQLITTADKQTVVIGVTQDITAEVQMNQQLMERIHFAELLGDTIIDRIIVTDMTNNIISWNKNCEQFYGIPKEQVLGRNYFDVLPQQRVPQVMEQFKKALAGESVHVPVMPGTHAMGQFQEVFFVPLKNENEEVIGVLQVMHDITRQQYLQDELSGRLQFIEKLLEASVDRIMAFDKDLHFQLWNRQCEKYYGFSKQQVIGKNILEIFPKFKSDRLYQYCQQALEGQTTHVPPEMTEGLNDYSESFFVPLRNESKEVTGILWVMHDLTDHKKTEAQILKQKELLRQAEEIAHVGSWELNVETNDLLWSDQVFTIYGYGAQAFEPNLDFYLDTVYEEDRQLLRAAIDNAINSDEPQALTCRILTLDGELKHIHTRARGTKDASGKINRVVGTMQDITEQKMMEAELRKNNQMLRTQFEIDHLSEKMANFGSWQWDVKAGTLLWTGKMFRLFGLRPYSFEPTIESFIELVHPADKDRIREEWAHIQQMNEGVLPDHEFRVMVNNNWRYFRVSSRMMRNRVIIGTTMDVTQDAQLRQQLSEKIRQLEEMNEELRSFAFVASHDLREPLRKIQIFSDWLLQKETNHLSQEGMDKFARIQKAVGRMDALIDAILDFSRIDAAEKMFSRFELSHVLETVKKELQETIDQTQAVIEADPLPAITGNQSQFMQLFRNLLDNALKYRKPGVPPAIRISCNIFEGSSLKHASAKPDLQYARISFEDNGIGFEAEYARKIFQMFQRLHGNNEYYGTGMGLAIAKKILEHHDGFITAKGKAGEGAAFECYIPC